MAMRAATRTALSTAVVRRAAQRATVAAAVRAARTTKPLAALSAAGRLAVFPGQPIGLLSADARRFLTRITGDRIHGVTDDQLTSSVLMVNPAGFRSNEETKQDNKFMGDADASPDVSKAVMEEWNALVSALEKAGVEVVKMDAQGLPDEVFPNNWFSTHNDGRIVIYPMKVPSRAKEVREDVIEGLKTKFGLNQGIVDFSGWKESGIALEGTGSLVLDRPSRVAYMSLSKRADKNIAELWAKEMGYELVTFKSADGAGEEIYHTNVLLSVGSNFAVVCLEAIPSAEEQAKLLAKLKAAGKVVLPVSMKQMENFACNCLQVQGKDGGSVLAMSGAAWDSLDFSQRGVLESCVDRIVAVPVPTIERLGGGSVRCMIAELFPAKGHNYVAASGHATESPCNLTSETGQLELVIVHEPGLEVDAVMPWTLEPMKVDECFNRVDLKSQHREFAQLLRARGAEVVHIRDLLTAISTQGEDAKRRLFSEVWGQEFVDKVGLSNLKVDHLVTGYSRGPLDFEQPPLMNLFFMRDPVFCVPGGWVVVSRPYFPIRQIESRLVRAIFHLHPRFKNVKLFEGLSDDPEVSIEGGDVLVVDSETVLVGVSQRTNERGAVKLAEFLFANTPVTRVVKVFIPKQRAFMHLDTLFTFVDKGVVLTMPYFWSKPSVYAELARRANALNEKMGSTQRQDLDEWTQDPPRIEMMVKGEEKVKKYKHAMSGLMAEGIVDKALYVCGPEGSWPTPEEHAARALTEQWNDAANVFCISPGTVVAYKWCQRTVTYLQDNGIDVIELDGVELMKGRGGARCMTFPMRRRFFDQS